MIKAIIYAYDPEVIILGGSIAKAFKYFEAPMKTAISDFQFPETVKSLKILLSNIDNIAVLGAAALVKNDNLN